MCAFMAILLAINLFFVLKHTGISFFLLGVYAKNRLANFVKPNTSPKAETKNESDPPFLDSPIPIDQTINEDDRAAINSKFIPKP